MKSNYKINEKVSFILKINKNITNISWMFSGCDSLLSINDIQNNDDFIDNTLIFDDINKEINYSYGNNQNDGIFNPNEENNFYKNMENIQKLSSISTITNKYTSNIVLTNDVNDEDNLLASSECYNFNNILNMNHMFSGCKSLISLMDVNH